MEERTITIAECRNLREIIHDITSGCFLTENEYSQICNIVIGAVQRCVKEEQNEAR